MNRYRTKIVWVNGKECYMPQKRYFFFMWVDLIPFPAKSIIASQRAISNHIYGL